jgi:transposase-like protein
VLFIVDNRKFRRLAYQVLDTNPTKEDMEALFERFKAALDARGLRVRGITTDGSELYPDAIAKVFPGARHQVCEFHVVKEIVSSVLQALAKVRKEIEREIPKLPRGRPTKETKALARKAKRLREKKRELFDNRHLFVKRKLTDPEKRTLAAITRGRTDIKRLREIMDEVYRLFDRRCRTETALVKLARLRRKAWRFRRVRKSLKKLWSKNLEKALTFLDDSLLPPTSNAVERTNRRHRKMQKTVYRVRTAAHVSQRIATDCLREARAEGRATTSAVLHLTRARSRAAPVRVGRRRKAA